MGLNKKQERQEESVDPKYRITIRALVVGYLLYSVYDIVRMYLAGGEDAPSLTIVLIAVVLLGGGGIWTGVTIYKQWKQMKQEETAAKQTGEEE